MSRENQAIITVRYYVGRGPRAKPGQALQEARREHRHRSARRYWLGGQAGGDRRRARGDAYAEQQLFRRHDAAPGGRGGDAAPCRCKGRVAGVCCGRAAAGGAGAHGPGSDGGTPCFALGAETSHSSGQRARDGWRFPQLGPIDSRRGRRAVPQCPAIERSGRRRVRRPAGLPQGRCPGRGRAGGSQQLRAPWLGTGSGFHRARVLSRHRSGRSCPSAEPKPSSSQSVRNRR